MAAGVDSKWYLVHEVILDCTCDEETFFNAINVWLERPQVLNRRLVGSYFLQSFQTTKRDEILSRIFAMSDENGSIPREHLLQLQSNHENKVANSTSIPEDVLEIKIRTLIPRQSNKYKNVSEVIIQDKKNRSVKLIPFEEDKFSDKLFSKIEHAYQVSLHDQDNCKSLHLYVLAQRTTGNGITCPTTEWLISCLLPKVQKWMMEGGTNVKFFGSSLQLVPVDRYSQKYEELKRKYGHFVKMWPERTDPHKFVYEDVAIATYLLLLWENEQNFESENRKVQTFVDLGCGNGLLVHILTHEGHLGKGIDLRPRKVWKFYDDKTKLQVTTLDPSSLTCPDADWLIGNHSDELTPWIPVIAARSSFKCKYFVLPCCFHDFYCKFQRASSHDTQYQSYLNYVNKIGQTCGFEVRQDVLRIPSTKKVCQIGQVRTYVSSDQATIEQDITAMLSNAEYLMGEKSRSYTVEKQFNSERDTLGSPQASKYFVPRSNKEPVKNCTQLEKELLENIVQRVASELLSRSRDERVIHTREKDGIKVWNKGGSMKLDEVSRLFDQKVLNKLRHEAGGIKTVLRNSHQVFKVCSGMVEMRDWQLERDPGDHMKKNGAMRHWKTRLCWFYINHPDGCPLFQDKCSFAHGSEDMKTFKFTHNTASERHIH